MTENEELIYKNEQITRESEERMQEIHRLRTVIRGEDARTDYEVMSFLYWLANWDHDWLDNCFGGNMHLTNKFESIVRPIVKETGCITPGAIIKFFYELSPNNQQTMIEYVRRTYTGMETHKPK